MTRLLFLLVASLPLYCQELDLDSYLRVLRIAPGVSIESKVKALDELGITLSRSGLRELERRSATPAIPAYRPPAYATPQLRSQDGEGNYLGNLNSNRSEFGFEPVREVRKRVQPGLGQQSVRKIRQSLLPL